MIRQSTKWNEEDRVPFLLAPAGKDYIWGGDRLKTEFGKKLDMHPLAETWECSTHPDGLSVVASGMFAGQTLRDVLRAHPEWIGTHPDIDGLGEGEIPVLVKFIDAKRDLSVQVHPDDAYAFRKEDGQRGKTEMWYVMDALPGAKLVYGFQNDMTREMLQKSLEEGTVEKYLQKIKIKKNDVFFIEAGTVHAIGAGALIAEIQENSNLTYRLFDYNRKDKNGKLRPLHKEKALDVARLENSRALRQPMRVLRYRRGSAVENLTRCKYFQVKRFLLNTEASAQVVRIKTQPTSFQIFLCMEGNGEIRTEHDVPLHFQKGDCVFAPADSVRMEFLGKAQLLRVIC